MPEIFDIEKAVEKWAMQMYQDTATRRQKKLLKKDVKLRGDYLGKHIDWTDVVFEHKTEWYNILPVGFQGNKEDEALSQKSPLHRDPAKDVKPDEDTRSRQASKPHVDNLVHSSVLFQTHYSNNTGEQQEYTMRTEKTTRSTCTTSLDHSFTKGMEMSVTMKSPGELVEASAGFHAEETLTNSAGQEFGEELTWGVESLIKVKTLHRADAQLIVEEKKNKGDFEVITTAYGMVYVTFTNKADNNSFVKATRHDLAAIVTWYMDNNKKHEFVTVDKNSKIVTIRTKGRCNFRYGVKQEIEVNEVPIEGLKSQAD